MAFTLRHLCAALALALATGSVHAALDDTAMAPQNSDAKAVYWQGHDALKRGDFNAALTQFRDLETRLRQVEPAAADAAIYWQAYALAQSRRGAEARTAVERLHRDYPASRWGGDADALLRESSPRAADAPKAAADSDADDLAAIAIDGLLSASPERALPLLHKVLDGNYSTKVKKRALFVLSQTGDDGAIETLEKLASGGDASLQKEAIQMLGISGEPRAMQALERIHGKTTDPKLRRDLLHAFMVAGEDDTLLRIARTDTDPDQRTEAVHLLGAMGANAELKTLFDATTDKDVRRAVMKAYGISGDIPALTAIASAPGDEDLRIEAIESLGVAGGGDALISLYPRANTPELREAVLKGLLISGNSKGLLELYKTETDLDTKKRMLRTLSVMGDDTALDAIEDALQP